MGEEWVPTKVADLKAGDEIRGWGVVQTSHFRGNGKQSVSFDAHRTEFVWPSSASIDVRRPGKVTVDPYAGFPTHSAVRIDGVWVATLGKRHAECYAEKLRNRPDLRTEALGQS